MHFLDPIRRNTVEILTLGEQLSAYDGVAIANRTLRRGGTVEDFLREISAKVREEPLHRAADKILGIESSAPEFQAYSISRAIKAAYDSVGLPATATKTWENAGLEKAVSDLAQTRTGTAPNGQFFLPLGLLSRDFNAGTAAQAGNLISSIKGNDAAADPLRKASELANLGATTLTGLRGDLSVPRFESSSAAGWKGEVAAAAEITETTQAVSLAPKRVTAVMVASLQALFQTIPLLDQTLARHLRRAIMEQLDDACINGTGGADDVVGVRSTSGVGAVVGGTDGAALTFAHLADLEDLPRDANVPETLSGYLVNSKTRRWLRTQPKDTGLDYCWQGGNRPLLGHRAPVSNTLPSNLTKGSSGAVCSTVIFSADWSNLLIGIYGGGVDVTVDRYTLADVGKLRVVLNLYVGAGVLVPGAFAKMDDAKTA